MVTHARAALALVFLAALAPGCRTSELAGNRPAVADDEPTVSTTELAYTHPVVSTDIPHAPLRTMGGSYAGTQWVNSPENVRLLQEMIAKRLTPQTIHTTTIHLQRTMTVTTGCGDDPATSVSHDTWCDYSLDNRNDEPYNVGATTLHRYRHTTGSMHARASASEEREYRPSATDTIVRRDSVPSPTGPTDGPAPRGAADSGGSGWTICWEYYELDLTTGDITLLFTTCPVSPGGRTQSASPAAGTVRAARDTAREPQLVGVSALLVQVPALPRGAKIMVQRTRSLEHPYLILGTADASDSDWAGGIEVVKAVVRRDGAEAPPAAFALGRGEGRADPELRGRAAALRVRLQSARRRVIPGFGEQRAIPLALFIER